MVSSSREASDTEQGGTETLEVTPTAATTADKRKDTGVCSASPSEMDSTEKRFDGVRWFPTLQALTRKNVLLLRAAKWQLFLIFLMPLIAMSLTYTLQRVTENINDSFTENNNDFGSNTASSLIEVLTSPSTQAVRKCQWYDVYGVEGTDECATILFAPSTEHDLDNVNRIMEYIATEASLPFVPIVNDTNENEKSSSSPYYWMDSGTWSGGAIVGVPTVQDLGEFVVAHPGRAQSIVYFASEVSNNNSNNNTITSLNDTRPLIHFRFNDTRTGGWSRSKNNNGVLIPMALRRAMLAHFSGKSDIKIRISKRNMYMDPSSLSFTDGNSARNSPTSLSEQELNELEEQRQQQEADTREAATQVVAYLFGPVFLFAIAISSAILSTHVAAEKSDGLIGSLRVVGMADSAYWFSWWVVGTVLVVIPSCLFAMILAYILNIRLLTEVNFMALLITLIVQYTLVYAFNLFAVALATNRPFLYALYFIILCLCVVSVSLAPAFQGSPEDSVGRSFQYLVPGYNLGGVIDSMYRFNSRAGFSNEARKNFTMYEFANFFNAFGECNQTVLEINNTCEEIELFDDTEACWWYTDCRDLSPEEIYSWTECAPDSCFFYPMADATRNLVMIVQTLLLMLFSWYILQVVPSENGLTYRPWFVFTRNYWFGARVGASSGNNGDTSIVLRGLTKSFGSNTAVNQIDMEIQNGQVFVLLGHNGSGKTTTINMLTGKLSPTSGDAYVMGYSVKDNVHSIQRLVGSVPQHDLLWGSLSAAEHIRMFAQIKGIRKARLRDEVVSVLQKVHLSDSGEQPAGEYSGGMKRRLSIALAGIGGPRVIILDEPTTGIDPLNRRRIWKLVRELKRDRIVILTTHLMQEADCLGDYIAILDKGRIQAQGTPLNLKTEYGSGYTLSVVTDVGNIDRVKSLALEMMPKIDLVNEAAGSLAFGVHNDELSVVPQFIRMLQNEKILREWNISQSTIEEVFLRLASKSTELQNRRQEMIDTVDPENMSSAVGATSEDEINSPELDEADKPLRDKEGIFANTKVQWRLQLGALLRKAYILKRRHWISSVIQLAIPVALMALAKKFFFEDLQIDPQSDVLVWPQATVYRFNTQIDAESPCTFEWKLSSVFPSTTTADLQGLLDPTNAAALIQSSISSEVLSFRVDGLSGQQSEELNDAIVQALEYYLSRAATEGDQDAVDSFCETSQCGPCVVEPLAFSFRELTTTNALVSIDGLGSYGAPLQCSSSFRPCSLAEYQIMLSDPMTAERASLVLNTSSPIAFDRVQMYVQDRAQLSTRLFSSPYLEVSNEQKTASSYYGDRCHDCPGIMPHIWVSGPNADFFVRAVEETGFEFSTEIVSEDIISSIVRNRRSINDNATVFSSMSGFDTSACSDLGQDDLYSSYGNILSNDRGYIVNNQILSPWYPANESAFNEPDEYDGFSPGSQPDYEEQCDTAVDPLTFYRDLFPDGGVTLAGFEIANGSIALDAIWEIDTGNSMYQSYYQNEPFVPSRQSIYAVYCPPNNVDDNGACDAEATLKCVRVIPSSGCQGYSSSPSDADIVDATYRVLWEASGASRTSMPVVANLNGANVDYHAAVSYEDLSIFVFMLTVIVAIQAPNTSSILVFEKSQRFVFALLLNGLRIPLYWIAQYMAHLLTCGILILTAILLAVALRLKAFTTQNPDIGMLFLVILIGIHAQFGFVVLFSGFFKKERFAAVVIGFLALTLLGAALLTDIASSNSLKKGWPPALSLIPMFGFYRSLFLVFWNRYTNELWTQIGVTLGSSTLYGLFGIYWQTTTGVGALYPNDCGGLFSRLLGLRDSSGPMLSSSSSSPIHHDNDDMDDVAEADIAKEEHRASQLSPEETAIKIMHLGKTFPGRPAPKHAVVDVTMAMDYGEIFGLLGPNGAGKTTVISMVVGQMTPSRGQAFVGGYDTVTDRRRALSQLGIVPQFDVYYPELTVREHLMLYAAMKGVQLHYQDSWSQSIAASVGLGSRDLYYRQAHALSGGMRRRLSIAVALLSSPSCVFLDEPTTGLDPEMKRSIWTIIDRIRHGQDRCVILTTHAMEEAEALCTRIGIMAQGNLQCIGTSPALRERYGSTYELTFTVPAETPSHCPRLLDFLQAHGASSATLVRTFGETRVITVHKSDLDLTDLLELIVTHQGGMTKKKKNKKKKDSAALPLLLYTEWGITNTTLDEVFIAITSESEGVQAGEI